MLDAISHFLGSAFGVSPLYFVLKVSPFLYAIYEYIAGCILLSLAHFNQDSVVVLIYTCANLLNNGSASSLAAKESDNSFPAATILAFFGNFHVPLTSLSKIILKAIP